MGETSKRKISVGFYNPIFDFEKLNGNTIYVGLWKQNDTNDFDPIIKVSLNAKSNKEFKYITYSANGEEISQKGKMIKDLLLDSPARNYRNFIDKLQKMNHADVEYRFEEEGLNLTRRITHLDNVRSHLELKIARGDIGVSVHDINP
jgi:hypothetical protein